METIHITSMNYIGVENPEIAKERVDLSMFADQNYKIQGVYNELLHKFN